MVIVVTKHRLKLELRESFNKGKYWDIDILNDGPFPDDWSRTMSIRILNSIFNTNFVRGFWSWVLVEQK